MTLKLTFACEKVTPNTVMFKEVIDADDVLAQPQVGNLYIPKRTLRDLGWQGERFKVTIEQGEKVA